MYRGGLFPPPHHSLGTRYPTLSPGSSVTPAGCPTVQLNADTLHLHMAPLHTHRFGAQRPAPRLPVPLAVPVWLTGQRLPRPPARHSSPAANRSPWGFSPSFRLRRPVPRTKRHPRRSASHGVPSPGAATRPSVRLLWLGCEPRGAVRVVVAVTCGNLYPEVEPNFLFSLKTRPLPGHLRHCPHRCCDLTCGALSSWWLLSYAGSGPRCPPPTLGPAALCLLARGPRGTLSHLRGGGIAP